jgi:hypothetical protein
VELVDTPLVMGIQLNVQMYERNYYLRYIEHRFESCPDYNKN